MTRYVLDTNVLVHLVRDSEVWKFVDVEFQPLDPPNESYIAFVSVAEILSLVEQFAWGEQKKAKLLMAIQNLSVLAMDRDLIAHYVEIEKYNHCLLSQKPPSGSPYKMGKNDIWIAATAVKAQAEIITCDKGFNHLKDVFCEVHYLDPSNFPPIK